jgi:hypothetical protein
VARGPAPSCARDFPRNDPRKRTQEALECLAAARSNQQMQVRAHIGKIVDSHIESTGHVAEHSAHGTCVFAKVPWTTRTVAMENYVHRPARADGAFELTPAAPNAAAVFGSLELGAQVAGK